MKKKIAGAVLAIATFVAILFGGSAAQAANGPNWINYHEHVVAWNVWGPFDRVCMYADYRSATGIVIAKHVAIKCYYDIYY